jgi:hypothetical protein
MGNPDLQVELSVNGKPIAMNEFVHKIVGNLVWAILQSVRLDEEPKSATVTVKVKI